MELKEVFKKTFPYYWITFNGHKEYSCFVYSKKENIFYFYFGSPVCTVSIKDVTCEYHTADDKSEKMYVAKQNDVLKIIQSSADWMWEENESYFVAFQQQPYYDNVYNLFNISKVSDVKRDDIFLFDDGFSIGVKTFCYEEILNEIDAIVENRAGSGNLKFDFKTGLIYIPTTRGTYAFDFKNKIDLGNGVWVFRMHKYEMGYVIWSKTNAKASLLGLSYWHKQEGIKA